MKKEKKNDNLLCKFIFDKSYLFENFLIMKKNVFVEVKCIFDNINFYFEGVYWNLV